jgi:hypothetical protein
MMPGDPARTRTIVEQSVETLSGPGAGFPTDNPVTAANLLASKPAAGSQQAMTNVSSGIVGELVCALFGNSVSIGVDPAG